MKETRGYHGCAMLMHNNVNYALIAGGGHIGIGGGTGLSSTEILDLDSGTLEWIEGK